MIVDDDRATVTLLQTLLEMDGFDVILCPHGGEVLEKARKQRPDLVLMDYHLSDTEGLGVLKAIRADPKVIGTPVVMTSGLDVGEECKAEGADEFLLKPFEPGSLAGLFNHLIEKSRAGS
jgi:CheY-like chemotaxis protein